MVTDGVSPMGMPRAMISVGISALAAAAGVHAQSVYVSEGGSHLVRTGDGRVLSLDSRPSPIQIKNIGNRILSEFNEANGRCRFLALSLPDPIRRNRNYVNVWMISEKEMQRAEFEGPGDWRSHELASMLGICAIDEDGQAVYVVGPPSPEKGKAKKAEFTIYKYSFESNRRLFVFSGLRHFSRASDLSSHRIFF